MKKELLDEYLDDIEKLAIERFVENDVQREAVKKVVLFELYQNGVLKRGEPSNPRRNSFHGVAMTADDPAKIGQRVMAMAEGINFLEMAFEALSKYAKKPKVGEEKENQAR